MLWWRQWGINPGQARSTTCRRGARAAEKRSKCWGRRTARGGRAAAAPSWGLTTVACTPSKAEAGIWHGKLHGPGMHLCQEAHKGRGQRSASRQLLAQPRTGSQGGPQAHGAPSSHAMSAIGSQGPEEPVRAARQRQGGALEGMFKRLWAAAAGRLPGKERSHASAAAAAAMHRLQCSWCASKQQQRATWAGAGALGQGKAARSREARLGGARQKKCRAGWLWRRRRKPCRGARRAVCRPTNRLMALTNTMSALEPSFVRAAGQRSWQLTS